MKVLQIGLGGFGRNHLYAWHEMGLGEKLYIADLSQERLEQARTFNVPSNRMSHDLHDFLDEVDVVDIVTPSTSHFDLAKLAIEAGKDVFVEKPMTMNSEEAYRLAAMVKETGRLVQVGFYYRFHPTSIRLKSQIEAGSLGALRYLSGNFMGFKRARTDVGVTHTDGIHFLDLFNWFLGDLPHQVYAVTRDHFERGLEDSSVVLLQYPGGAFVKVESGYIQPGKWRDKVVPNAFTSKEIFVCGDQATAEVDFETEYMTVHDVHQEFRGGTWAPVTDGSNTLGTGTATPVQMVAAELKDFLDCVATRRRPSADVTGSGVVLARLMEAIYQSAGSGTPVSLNWSQEERDAIANTLVSQ